MIFRKPYGFLIKHFKLIHLILTGLYVFLAFHIKEIFGYYDKFAKGSVSKLSAMSYVNDNYIIVIFISTIICLIVYALMRYKKKPSIFYVILIVFYLVVGVMINISYDGLSTIYMSVLETKTLRLYRDLLQIMLWLQYIPIAMVFIRGLGFDIKKFNFVQDLHELNIDVSDEEEVELTFGGTEIAQRKVHRSFRELKYYYLENRMFINIILIVGAIVLFSTIQIDKNIINKEYQEGEMFSVNDHSFQVLDSFITTKNYEGNVVGDLNHSFVILRMMVRGNKKINTANLILDIDGNDYTTVTKKYSYFKDLGNVYSNQDIVGEDIYLFLFSVEKADLDKKMRLVYGSDKVVHLSPISLDKINNEKKYSLGSKMDITMSSVDFGYFMINSYDIKDKFLYSYKYEVMGKEYTGELSITSSTNVILHLKIDSEYSKSFTDYDVLSTYAKLKYKIGDEEYTSVFSDKTPGSYKEGLYLAVDKNIVNASNIWFEIQIRNQKYLYTIL